jgi:hypothetical protein
MNGFGRSRGSGLNLTPTQVGVVFVEPVMTDGRENVEVERVFKRHGPVWDVGRNQQQFAFSHDDLPALQFKLQGPVHDVSDLLAFVVM